MSSNWDGQGQYQGAAQNVAAQKSGLTRGASPPPSKAGVFGHLSACPAHWREFSENVDNRGALTEQEWSDRYRDIEQRVIACQDCAIEAALRLDLVGERVGRRPSVWPPVSLRATSSGAAVSQ